MLVKMNATNRTETKEKPIRVRKSHPADRLRRMRGNELRGASGFGTRGVFFN